MPKTLDDLKAKNRAWADEMTRQDPGFFKSLAGQQAPHLAGLRGLGQAARAAQRVAAARGV